MAEITAVARVRIALRSEIDLRRAGVVVLLEMARVVARGDLVAGSSRAVERAAVIAVAGAAVAVGQGVPVGCCVGAAADTEGAVGVGAMAVEVIAGGGIGPDDMERLLSLTVKEAHLSAMFETFPDIPFLTKLNPDWKAELSMDTAYLLDNRVVIK